MRYFNTFLFISLIGFLSCSKDEKIFIPDHIGVINQKVILEDILGSPDVFVINITAEPYLFKDKSGNILEIPTDALISTTTGLPVRGEVKLVFQENSKQKSTMLNSPSTSVDGKLFKAKSMVRLRFYQNEKDLSFSKPLQIYLPSESSNTLPYLFESKVDDNNKFEWKLEENPDDGLKFSEWKLSYLESTIVITGYKMGVRSNNQWYAIGEISNQIQENPGSICVGLDHTFNNTNSLVYFVAENENIVLKLESTSANTWEFCAKNIFFTEGMRGNFVVISDIALTNYFFGMTNAVLNNDTYITVNTFQQSKEKIKETLLSL